MRVYHLLKTEYGLQSIARRRMRISRFSDLNDPFELLGANLRNKVHREAFRNWKKEVSEKFGLMCFSRSWGHSLLWSHYGDRHRGLCLGFDVPDSKVHEIRYVKDRLEIDEEALDEALIMRFLTTKFVEWNYEREVRAITDLSEIDPVDGSYYVPMSDDLQLRAVVVGALSHLTRDQLMAEIEAGGLDPSRIVLTKARLAFKSYDVVRDKRGLR